MANLLVFFAIVYAVYSLSVPVYGNYTAQVENLREDIKAEIERGGLWGFVCHLIQPLIGIIILPFISQGAAIGLAVLLLMIGLIF